MQLLKYSLTHPLASGERAPRFVPIGPQLCSAMVLTMNAYGGRFTLAHLAKVREARGQGVFGGPLQAFAEAVLREGAVDVAFAPRDAKSPDGRSKAPEADR
jgi:hypothetical protein